MNTPETTRDAPYYKKCNHCGADVVWVNVENGRPVLLDLRTTRYKIIDSRVVKMPLIQPMTPPDETNKRAQWVSGPSCIPPLNFGEVYIDHVAICPELARKKREAPRDSDMETSQWDRYGSRSAFSSGPVKDYSHNELLRITRD